MALERRARAWALAAHGDQQYGAQPYAVHLQAVRDNVAAQLGEFYVLEQSFSDTALAAAWCHDVLEDTRTTSAQLAAATSPDVARIVELLSNQRLPNGDVDWPATVARVGAHPIARLVKLADRLANSRVSAAERGTSAKARKTWSKYTQQWPRLREEIVSTEWPLLWHALAALYASEA